MDYILSKRAFLTLAYSFLSSQSRKNRLPLNSALAFAATTGQALAEP